VVAARFEGEGLPEPTESEGVGYRVYHLSEVDEPAEPSAVEPSAVEMEPPPPTTEPVESAPHNPTPRSGRTREVLVLVALLCLLAALLAFWL
jgi:hypothetical protein